MNRLLIALMTAVCCVFGNMNSFVYAEGETEEDTAEIQETEQPAEEQITEETEEENQETETEETIQETETPPEETPAAEETAEVIPEEESLPAGAEPVTEEAEDTEVSVTEDEPETSLFTYEVSGGEAVITGYTGSESDIVIPAYIDGYPVIEIGSSAFEDTSGLTNAAIENGVQKIGYRAFAFCQDLVSITLPDSVNQIDESAFSSCRALTSVNIPYGVTRIENYTFSYCSTLPNIVIPDSVTSIGIEAFSSCRGLENINIPSSVTMIEDNAFRFCSNLLTVNLGEGVQSIGEHTFQNTGLLGIEFPASLRTVGRWAFEDNPNLHEFVFWGDAPSFPSNAVPSYQNITVYYPANNRTYPFSNWGINIYKQYIPFNTDNARPAFSGHQLILTGTLGLRFGMIFPEDFDSTGSYMEFYVGRETQPRIVYTDDADDENGRKVYTCYVNSLQMADTIKAVFHYGGIRSVENTYSVVEYISYFDNPSLSYDAETISLIRAVADYGYFAQPYLIGLHHIEGKYAPMTKHYSDSFDLDAVAAAVAGYTFARDLSGSQLRTASYSLSLDSETVLTVFLAPRDNAEVSASTVFSGTEYTAELQPEGIYTVRVPGIKASQLGTNVVVRGNAGGQFTVSVSALSYVRTVLSGSGYSDEAKNTVAALYKYYEAVQAYKSAHNL